MKQSNSVRTKGGRYKNVRSGRTYGKKSKIGVPGYSMEDSFDGKWFKATKVEPLPPDHPDAVVPRLRGVNSWNVETGETITDTINTETWDA